MNDSRNIPTEVDVWSVVESELNTGLVDVLDMSFKYVSGNGGAKITIRHPKDSRIQEKQIELDGEAAENLVIKLAKRFNFHWTNIKELSFWLKPGELPWFDIKIYPRVSDPSILNNRKCRLNALTID